MPSTPKGLSDEKAARVLVAFREGRTLRQFAMRAGRFDAYCKAHPEYAREALPLLEANRKAGDKRKGERHRSQTHCKTDTLWLMPGFISSRDTSSVIAEPAGKLGRSGAEP